MWHCLSRMGHSEDIVEVSSLQIFVCPEICAGLSHSLVLFLYLLPAEADKAIKALNGRYFGGRVVTAEVYDEDKFEANDLTH